MFVRVTLFGDRLKSFMHRNAIESRLALLTQYNWMFRLALFFPTLPLQESFIQKMAKHEQKVCQNNKSTERIHHLEMKRKKKHTIFIVLWANHETIRQRERLSEKERANKQENKKNERILLIGELSIHIYVNVLCAFRYHWAMW